MAPRTSPPLGSSSNEGSTTRNGVRLEDLKFNAVGLRILRAYLGEGDIYRRFQSRFDAADIAWFVAGAHKDGAHFLPLDRFHGMWKDARVVEASGTDAVYRTRREFRDRLRDLVWDALTVLDRISGGASVLLHSPGTVEPGQRLELPFLKLDVYAPPFIFNENPLVDRPLAAMVQTFAEEVALPATQRWHRAFDALGYSLKKDVPVVEPPSHLPFMPEPQKRTTLYRCRGRRAGELDAMLAQAPDDAGPTDRNGPGRRDGRAGRSGATVGDDIDSLRATIAHLEELLKEKDAQLAQRQDAIVTLGDIIDDREGDVLHLEEEVEAREIDIIRLEEEVEAREIDIVRLEEEVEALRQAPPPPVLVPQPIRAQPPVPTPTPTPTPTTSRSRPSLQVPAAAPPPYAAVLNAPISSRMSSLSLSSSSNAISSLPPLPSPSNLRSPNKMDGVRSELFRQSPALVVTTSTSTLATPASGLRPPTSTRTPTLTRFDVIGPRTQGVLAARNLPSTLHRSLRDVVNDQPQSLWYNVLTEQMSLQQEVALEVIQALEEDVPLE